MEEMSQVSIPWVLIIATSFGASILAVIIYVALMINLRRKKKKSKDLTQ